MSLRLSKAQGFFCPNQDMLKLQDRQNTFLGNRPFVAGINRH